MNDQGEDINRIGNYNVQVSVKACVIAQAIKV